MSDPNANAVPPLRHDFDPEPWRGELLAFLLRRGAADEAEDIVQETFLRSVRRPPQGDARPWLYGIALNLLRDRRRAEKRDDVHLPRVATGATDPLAGPAADAERRDLAVAARRAFGSLSRSQRTALELRIDKHLDYEEIGARLGCSAATARQHFYLGMKAVRDHILGGRS